MPTRYLYCSLQVTWQNLVDRCYLTAVLHVLAIIVGTPPTCLAAAMLYAIATGARVACVKTGDAGINERGRRAMLG
jgi:hypothetical protein